MRRRVRPAIARKSGSLATCLKSGDGEAAEGLKCPDVCHRVGGCTAAVIGNGRKGECLWGLFLSSAVGARFGTGWLLSTERAALSWVATRSRM